MKRTISLLLIFSIAFSMYTGLVYAAESDNTSFEQHTISVFSNVIGAVELTLYQDSGKRFYMNADDICKLTRSTLSQQGNNSRFRRSNDIRSISHGIRKITLQVSQNELTEPQFKIKHNINMHLHNGVLLIEAEPMLRYLGASLQVNGGTNKRTVLYCNMPHITLWEAINTDFPEILDLQHFYGGKIEQLAELSCDVIMDMLFGHGLFVSENDYIKDAYYAILNYKFDEDDTMMRQIYDQMQESNKICSSYLNVLKDEVDMITSEVKARSKVWEITQKISYNNVQSATYNVINSSDAAREYYWDELEKAAKTNHTVNEIYDTHYGTPLNDLDKAKKILTVVSFTTNVMDTYSSLYVVNTDRQMLMNDVMASEKLRRYGVNTNNYSHVADNILSDLNQSSAKKLIKTMTDVAIEDIVDDQIGDILDIFTEGSFFEFKFAVDLSKFVVSLFLQKEIQAFSDELKGMYANQIQRNVAKICGNVTERANAEKWGNSDVIKDYRSALRYYCLTTLTVLTKIRDSSVVLNLSDKDRNKIYTIYTREINRVTKLYYALSTCEISPIPDIDSIDYNLLVFLITEDSTSSATDNVTQPSTSPTTKPPIINDNTYRDIVLVLDTSASMQGTPFSKTVASAKTFVSQVAGGNTRVGVVSYDSDAKVISRPSNSVKQLTEDIDQLWFGDMTNMYAGLSKADEMLQQSSAEKKIIVLMSDGMPNVSPNIPAYSNESYGDEVVAYAKELKKNGYRIYTLGFFQRLSGSDLVVAQDLMARIAGEGYYYDINEADSINFFFNDVATDIAGQHTILIKIACPVDVYVTHNGETLTSDQNAPNNRTSFGSITYTGENDEVKNVRLLEDADYDVVIQGTGNGVMNYIISYPDEEGTYTDVRTFEELPVTEKTVVKTNTKHKRRTVIKLDSDGDGHTDVRYRAGKGETGEVAPDYSNVMMIFVVLLALGVAVKWIGFERLKALVAVNRPVVSPVGGNGASAGVVYCENCGGVLNQDGPFCPHCGFDNTHAMQQRSVAVAPSPCFCGKCGTPLKPHTAFCGKCGNKITVRKSP